MKALAKQLILVAGETADFFPALGETGKWLHFTASPIKDATGEIIGAIETMQDVTESRAMQDRLRYYLGQITKVQEAERKRIARELHGETSQALYAVSRHIDNFSRGKADLPPDSARFLKELREELNSTSEGIRRFIQELRPPMLDDLGLLAALRWQASDLEKHSGIESVVIVEGAERRFPEEIELVIFRIVQEALSNVTKHAQAARVETRIEFGDGKTRITVTDNGRGFEMALDLADLPRSGKLGLAGMEERVRLLNGTMKVDSEPDGGTRVVIEVPV